SRKARREAPRPAVSASRRRVGLVAWPRLRRAPSMRLHIRPVLAIALGSLGALTLAACAGQPLVGACTGTETLCGEGNCVDLSSDPRNCGACGIACASGEACVDGACSTSCAEGEVVCGDRCVDLRTDLAHC